MSKPGPDFLSDFSLDPRTIRLSAGVAHPLVKFSLKGKFRDGVYADVILDFMCDRAFEEPDTRRYKVAEWFLLESGKTFFFACSEAGVDAGKLRSHLLECASGHRFTDAELEAI